MKSVKARRQQSTLARLCEECSRAAVVWTAMREMAEERGSAVLTPTRTQLSEMTGITRLKTISKALKALESAGWIDIAHVPVFEGSLRSATLLRIILRRGRYAPHTGKTAVEGATRPKGKGRHAPQDSSSRREEAPLRSEGAGRASPARKAADVHPAVLIQKKRLEEIRKRQSGEQDSAAEEKPGSVSSDELKKDAAKC